MARALVTGGAGFVGRHLCRMLISHGVDVVCVDPLLAGSGAIHPTLWPLGSLSGKSGFTFVEHDCRAWFNRHVEYFDMVFHLAAVVGGRLTIENHPLAVADDLSIDSSMWQWAAKVLPGHVVYFSSSAAYPLHLQTREHYVKLREDMISFDKKVGVPDMSYGWSKLTGEYLMRLYVERYGGNAVSFRPFSGYGEDQSMDYPFPSICNRLMLERGNEVVRVWGRGDQVRDFIHISDCIDFIWQSFRKLAPGSVLNLSSGVPTSFIQLATEVCRALGWAPEILGMSDKPEGVFYRCGDNTRQLSLGLVPKVTLADGIRQTLEFLECDRRGAGKL